MARKKPQAVVFGLFETGLGVIRSLGQKGIQVLGYDHHKDIAWYSRYVKPALCPHPVQQESQFVEWVTNTFQVRKNPLPVFFTSDDFLITYSKHREVLSKYFLVNMADHELLKQISDKYKQFELAKAAGINVPGTWIIHNSDDLNCIPSDVQYPLFIKGVDVNSWRSQISHSTKGYVVNTIKELTVEIEKIVSKGVSVIVQEVIEGPDTNHYKYCSYTSPEGNVKAEFTLQKVRQNPIQFGVGTVVESVEYPELINVGRKLFKAIAYRGVGSAEFKIDARDGRLKLIELNPRYWQQNYLPTACGMNFPWLDYQVLTSKQPEPLINFHLGIKWVNRYMDLDSFLRYRKLGELTFIQWRKSLHGKKVFADFTWDDPLPFGYELGFGWKLIKVFPFLFKRIFGHD